MSNKIDSTISDLFFMVDNTMYWELLDSNHEDSLEALISNAQDFCYLMNKLGFDIEHEDVVTDFFERI